MALKQEILAAEIELNSILANEEIPLGDVQKFKVGDIIPIDIEDEVTTYIEDIPLFKGRFGRYNGQCAIKLTTHITPGNTDIEN